MKDKTIFYKKVTDGKRNRYVPVSEYDPELSGAFPQGAHLIVTHPGGRSTRYSIKPALAPLIAAGRFATDAISETIRKASDLRLDARSREKPLTDEQRLAWNRLIEVFGEEARQLEWPSAREAAEAGVDAMIEQAQWMLEHPMVKAAYDEFLMTAKLVLEERQR